MCIARQVASLIQFAGTSHFHVLTEVFGRLCLLLQAGILEDPETQLVVPKSSGVFAAGLKILTNLGLDERRLIYWTRGPSDVLLKAETLYFANWKVPVALGEDGGHCPTPASLLHKIRDSFTSFGHARSGQDHQDPIRAFVYLKRKKGDMRSILHRENDLEKELRDLVKNKKHIQKTLRDTLNSEAIVIEKSNTVFLGGTRLM